MQSEPGKGSVFTVWLPISPVIEPDDDMKLMRHYRIAFT